MPRGPVSFSKLPLKTIFFQSYLREENSSTWTHILWCLKELFLLKSYPKKNLLWCLRKLFPPQIYHEEESNSPKETWNVIICYTNMHPNSLCFTRFWWIWTYYHGQPLNKWGTMVIDNWIYSLVNSKTRLFSNEIDSPNHFTWQ